MIRKQSTAKSILALLAFGILACLPANADTGGARSDRGWIAHAEAVFAAADAQNLAIARARESNAAWVAHAEAVFAAADAENLAIARANESIAAWVAHAEAVFAAADQENLRRAHAMLARAN